LKLLRSLAAEQERSKYLRAQRGRNLDRGWCIDLLKKSFPKKSWKLPDDQPKPCD